MFQSLDIAPNIRIAHLRDGRFENLFGPGNHFVWTFSGRHDFLSFDVNSDPKALSDSDPLPADLYGCQIIEVADHERVAVFLHRRLRWILSPGRYRLWDALGQPVIERYSIRVEPQRVPDDDPLPPSASHTDVAATESQALVLCRLGSPFRSLEPGTWRLWNGGPWSVKVVSLSWQTLEIATQDLLSKDQVQVRVRAATTWRVIDALRFSREPDWQNQIYGAVHRALRDIVTARELEPLLADRTALSDELLTATRAFLPELGIELQTVVVRDVILPGEIKELFNKVTLARKEAEAMAIRRREETAQTRQLSNTARLLESNPVLLRLKELEGLTELASRIDNLTLVGSQELVQPAMLSHLVKSGERNAE